MKFRVEDSGEFAEICEACHPEQVNIEVPAKAESEDGTRVKVADVLVTGRLDWSRKNPLIEFQHQSSPIAGAYGRLRGPWYRKLSKAFSRIFRPSASEHELG
jgi:hypothetical protein